MPDEGPQKKLDDSPSAKRDWVFEAYRREGDNSLDYQLWLLEQRDDAAQDPTEYATYILEIEIAHIEIAAGGSSRTKGINRLMAVRTAVGKKITELERSPIALDREKESEMNLRIEKMKNLLRDVNIMLRE